MLSNISLPPLKFLFIGGSLGSDQILKTVLENLLKHSLDASIAEAVLKLILLDFDRIRSIIKGELQTLQLFQ